MYLGIYKDLSIEDYHGDIDSISRSTIMEIKKSPWHYYHAYLNPKKPTKEPTDAMNVGNAFHTMVLEPHLFDKQFVVSPEKVLLKDVGRDLFNEYKAQLEDIELNLGNKILLNAKQYDALCHMRDSVMNHDQASFILKDAEIEQSLFWIDQETGIRCKVRPDIWQSSIIADLKSIDDASENNFQKSIVEYGYHIQAAMIREGIREVIGQDIEHIVFIVVEKKYPYAVVTYILDEIALECGLMEFKKILLQLQACRETNTWGSYQNKIISLPNWALTRGVG